MDRRADNDNEDEQQRATLAVLRGEERGFQRICSRVVLSTTTRGIPVCAHSETQGEAEPHLWLNARTSARRGDVPCLAWPGLGQLVTVESR